MPYSAHLIEEIEKLDPQLRAIFIDLLKEIEKEREETITRREFLEFSKRTEENFQKVWKSIEKLTEAQIKLEEKVSSLAEAQNRTEEELRQLVIDHRETRRQLGGLSQTIGYTLENEAYKALPILLERDYKITLKEKLKRGYITTPSGEDIEINILGKGKLNGREITIIGECKSQLSKNDVDNFIRKKLEKVKQVIKGEIFPLIVTHMISQKDVEDYTREKKITLYYSYDFV